MALSLPRRAPKPVALKPAADPNTLVPLSTNFDYLSGSFARAERGRQSVAFILLLGVLLTSALLFGGLQSKTQVSLDTAQVAGAQASIGQVQAQLNQLDQAAGIPADTLRAHAQDRFAAYKRAVGTEVDLPRLLERLTSTAPAGITITSVKLDPVAPAKSKTDSKAPATPANTGQYALTLAATATSFEKIGEWSSAMTQIPGLTNPQPTWTGGGSSLVVTVTATLSSGAYSARALEAQRSDIYGLAGAVTTLPGAQSGAQPNNTPQAPAQPGTTGGN